MNHHAIKQAYIHWLTQRKWDVALSLNFKADISKENAQRAAAYFWGRIDNEYFSRNAVRHCGLRVPRVCVIEGETGVSNFHLHCAVAVPPDCKQAPDRFGMQLLSRWMELREAGEYSKMDVAYDSDGWIAYMCKKVGIGEAECCLRTTRPCF